VWTSRDRSPAMAVFHSSWCQRISAVISPRVRTARKLSQMRDTATQTQRSRVRDARQ
jgi:hypothetical protein